MFWLKKAIAFCLMPFTAGLGLIIFGVILSYRKQWPRLGRTLIVAGVLILGISSHRQVGLLLLQPLEQQYPAIPEFSAGDTLPTTLAACRYIVVLGGGHADVALLPATSKLSPYALARVVEGVRLARLLPEAKIITTGPGYPGLQSHAEILAQRATSLGLDP
ncbi:MAG: hypothetical protein K9N01_12265, partial [Cephaloticoccus sp.]|nr:hypothetical protein [Cephaloticoccus sp.]